MTKCLIIAMWGKLTLYKYVACWLIAVSTFLLTIYLSLSLTTYLSVSLSVCLSYHNLGPQAVTSALQAGSSAKIAIKE